MYMRFNPYHGGLLAERLTLDEVCEEKYYSPPLPEVN